MEPGESRLTLFTNENGGIVDDSIVTVQDDHIRVVVNAGSKEKDIKHLKEYMDRTRQSEFPDVSLEILEDHSLLALQGPLAMPVLQPLVSPATDLRQLLFMKGIMTSIEGIPDCTITRCGYTGEDGFEISCPNLYVESLVRRLLSNPSVKLAGLGARDALRLEAGMCLYGHDINESTTPVEASLSWTIGNRRRKEGGFLGAETILNQLQNGVTRKRVGLVTQGALAREGYEVLADEAENSVVGTITSGTFSPILKSPIAMGYIQTPKSKIGTQLFLNIHKKLQPAEIVKMPFVATSFYSGPH